MEPCTMPCLPKCCDVTKVLNRNPNGPHHGFECVDSTSKLSLDITLTEGKRKQKIENSKGEMKFYSGVFPSCEGLDTNWNYEYHNRFSVDVSQEEKFILFVNNSKVNMTENFSLKALVMLSQCFLDWL